MTKIKRLGLFTIIVMASFMIMAESVGEMILFFVLLTANGLIFAFVPDERR